MIAIIISSIVLIALIIASITDIKTREVPDWLNFSLVALGLGVRLIWSLATDNYSFILSGCIGFIFFFLIAMIMFYTGQWGGGDSKMFMGLGALIGLDYGIWMSLKFIGAPLVSFLINVVIVGSLYGLVWSFVMVIKNRKKFIKELKKSSRSIIKIRKIMIILFVVLVVLAILIQDIFIKLLIIALIVIVYSSFYLLIFVKVVEKSAMLKYVKPTEVTEGDWIAEDIFVGENHIAGPKDLGIEKKQMEKLVAYYKRGKIKRVLIKVGIPFVPSFLIAYIITLWVGNILLFFI